MQVVVTMCKPLRNFIKIIIYFLLLLYSFLLYKSVQFYSSHSSLNSTRLHNSFRCVSFKQENAQILHVVLLGTHTKRTSRVWTSLRIYKILNQIIPKLNCNQIKINTVCSSFLYYLTFYFYEELSYPCNFFVSSLEFCLLRLRYKYHEQTFLLKDNIFIYF